MAEAFGADVTDEGQAAGLVAAVADALGRAVLPEMQASGSGRIVQMDSEVVDLPPPGRSAYVTAKSAQIGLTRA